MPLAVSVKLPFERVGPARYAAVDCPRIVHRGQKADRLLAWNEPLQLICGKPSIEGLAGNGPSIAPLSPHGRNVFSRHYLRRRGCSSRGRHFEGFQVQLVH